MDLLELFRMIGQFFVRLCNIHFTVGGYDLTVGSVFLFTLCFSLVVWFLRGMSE